MKKKIMGLAFLGLIFFGANNCLADDPIYVKSGTGSVYNISCDNRKPFQDVAKKSSKEDSWICFDGKCYDVGFKERNGSVLADTRKVVDIVRSKNWKGDVYSRHIHPIGSPPSDGDITTHLVLESYLGSLGARVISEVFTWDGYWRYSVDPKLRKDVGKFFASGSLDRYLEDMSKVDSHPISRREKIEEFIPMAKKRGITLLHTFYE